MKRIFLVGLATLSLAAAVSAARADVIDFTGLANGDAGNPLVLTGATFTTLGGGFNMIGADAICPAPTSDNFVAVCTNTLQVDFDDPSSDVSFDFRFNNDHNLGADIGDVQVFDGAVLLGVANVLVVDADPFTKDLVNLASFGHVTRLVISTTDFGGVLYDDFTFTPGGVVPEPGAWALMIVGFGAAGAALRSRRRPLTA